MKVITTCSESNFDYLKALGAEHVYDYRQTDIVDRIRDFAPNLKYFFDAVGNESSTRLGAQALGDANPVMCTVRPNKAHTEGLATNIKVTAVLMWTAFGEAFDFRGVHWPVSYLSKWSSLSLTEIGQPARPRARTGVLRASSGISDNRPDRTKQAQEVSRGS